MRLSPVWVALAAIASFRQVILTQMPATYAAPPNLSTAKQTLTGGQGDKETRRQGETLSIRPSSSHLPISPFFDRKALIQALKVRQKPVETATTKSARFLALAPKKSDRTSLLLSQVTPEEQSPNTDSPNGNTPQQQQVQPNQSAPQRTPQTPPSSPQTTPTVPVLPAPGTESLPQQGTPNRIQVPIEPSGQPVPGAFPNQPNQTIPPSTPAPGTQPTSPTTPTPGTPPTTPTTPGQQETQPTTPTTPGQEQTQPSTTPEAAEARVLVAEVAVRSETGELSPELQNEVYRAISTQAGRTTTRSQLQQDINAVFGTGFFSNVRAVPEDTALGVRVSFLVEPNPVLRQVQVQANAGTNVASVLPPKVVEDIFRPQYGTILNLRSLQEGIKQLNAWYQKNGYVLAQVVEAPQVAPDGTVTLQVAEGVVEDTQVRFVREGQPTDDEGKPVKGRTRDFIIRRELETGSGKIFNRNLVQQDLQRVYGLGLFEDVNVSLNPGQDPRKVVVVVNVDERRTGSVGLSGGISSASGLFGALSYQEQNLGGNNQKLGAELQVGTERKDVLFDVRFTDPWIAGDPYRTSYTVNGFSRRSISLIFEGEDDDDRIEVGDDDRPRVLRLGGGVQFTRPLSRNPFIPAEWTASAGLQYQHITIRDADGNNEPIGRINGREIPLTFSGENADDLLTLQLGAQRDRRNNQLTPTSGSFLRLSTEQSVPVGSGSILLNRLRANYSQYIPVSWINFSKGPQALAFNLQAGTILGDLPPYEAFSLGGSNSVRGYGEGELGSGRSFLQATAEYRFPVFSIVGGAVFFDFGSDLGTAENVPGRPAQLLGKPGTGIGYGVGVRVNSPLGPLRLDYAFSDDGEGRLQFGIGEKF